AVRSDDGGATFGAHEVIARLASFRRRADPNLLRVFPLPAATVDGGGTVYVAWSDCRFRRRCRANDIVLAHSTAGGWSAPRRVPVTDAGTNANHVIPGVAADPGTSGVHARLALTFYTLRAAGCPPARCRLDVRLATSSSGGVSWTVRRLDAVAMRLAWLPRTNSGRMVGDYVATAYAAGHAVGVFALAIRPRGDRLDEAIHAVVR
ncbi:MAG TPA: sialidase family protein, partial [Gaiellaceae bacterium]|nr:sialidase family protein [Gaiellaceae bacterium]